MVLVMAMVLHTVVIYGCSASWSCCNWPIMNTGSCAGGADVDSRSDGDGDRGDGVGGAYASWRC
eukprot:9687781-Alexandrium_andersonii.AAC.1